MSYDDLFSPGLHKFIHHQEHIAKIQRGDVVGPIHVSIWPTNRCQLNCAYCCFKNRGAHLSELSMDDFTTAVDTLCRHGLKALEFSGGGEPLMWGKFEEAAKYAHSKGLKISLITNGLLLPYVDAEVLKLFSWVRVSIQSAAYAEKIIWDKVPDEVRVSASYIVNDANDLSEVQKIAWFAEKFIDVSVSPRRPCSIEDEAKVRDFVYEYSDYRLMFFGKAPGVPNGCYMPWIRAAIDWEGYFITCTSPEMAPEAERCVKKIFKLCRAVDLEQWLQNNHPRDMGHRCTFCNCGKEINDYINMLRSEVIDVDFV